MSEQRQAMGGWEMVIFHVKLSEGRYATSLSVFQTFSLW